MTGRKRGIKLRLISCILLLIVVFLCGYFLGRPGREEPGNGSSVTVSSSERPTPGQAVTAPQTTAAAQTTPPETEVQIPADSEMRVTFLDVGQGNAVLIQCGEHAMLVDGGPRGTSSFVVSYLQSHGIQKLEYIIATHYDTDHLAGLVGVLSVFPVDCVLNPAVGKEGSLYESFLEARDANGCRVIEPAFRETYSLGEASFTIVTPVKEGAEENNDTSIGIRLEHGKNHFLMLGDTEFQGEYDLLDLGMPIASDVYLASHHGSSSSSSERLLKKVSPKAVVISCGLDNSYGHPAKDVMRRLEDHGYDLYRTDLQGTIVAVSDGKTITFETEVCEDYSSGDELMSRPEETKRDVVEIGAGELWIGNKNSMKLHRPNCSYVPSEANRVYFDSAEEALEQGYILAKCCNP